MTVIIEKNVSVPLRDGVCLKADIYRPDQGTAFPVLLQRTPYNKEFLPIVAMTLDPIRAAAAGYAVVIQDVRSRWASDGGVFFPYANEEADGADTLDWIASQSFCDGNIGAYGLSYMGGTTWLSAVSGHPALKAISPTTAPNDFWRDHFWRDGVANLSTLVMWALRTIGPAALLRMGLDPASFGGRLVELVDSLDHFEDTLRQRPLDALAAAHPEDPHFVPFLFEILRHPAPDDWTRSLLFSDRHDQVKVPALIIAGWHDLLLAADLSHYAGMRKNGGSAAARECTRLVVGPWAHAMFLNYVGQVDFGFRSSGYLLDLQGDLTMLQLRWFDRWLRGADVGAEPRVRVFVQGRDRWRDQDEWPDPQTTTQRWFLGEAGTLRRNAPADEECPDAYVYDPENPCPTCGGNLLMPPQYTPGPVDQAPILSRRDVLVYTSEALPEDLEIAGEVRMVLYASSSGADADWVVKLCDLRPDGRTLNLCDGVVRASYYSAQSGEAYRPGLPQRWDISLWSTAAVLKAGHRLRLIVTSSDFPRYDRNPTTGENSLVASRSEPALQQVFHSASCPSCIELPVLPG